MMTADNKHDGDQMNVTLAIDDYSRDYFLLHQAHNGLADPNRPYGVASINNLPVPTLELLGNWIEAERKMVQAAG